jgi:hypothetical protein
LQGTAFTGPPIVHQTLHDRVPKQPLLHREANHQSLVRTTGNVTHLRISGYFDRNSVDKSLNQKRCCRRQLNAVTVRDVDFVATGARKAACAPIFDHDDILISEPVANCTPMPLPFYDFHLSAVLLDTVFDNCSVCHCGARQNSGCSYRQDENRCASFHPVLHLVAPNCYLPIQRLVRMFLSLQPRDSLPSTAQ